VTSEGRTLAIIQSTKTAGLIKVTAKADGFADQTVVIQSK